MEDAPAKGICSGGTLGPVPVAVGGAFKYSELGLYPDDGDGNG